MVHSVHRCSDINRTYFNAKSTFTPRKISNYSTIRSVHPILKTRRSPNLLSSLWFQLKRIVLTIANVWLTPRQIFICVCLVNSNQFRFVRFDLHQIDFANYFFNNFKRKRSHWNRFTFDKAKRNWLNRESAIVHIWNFDLWPRLNVHCALSGKIDFDAYHHDLAIVHDWCKRKKSYKWNLCKHKVVKLKRRNGSASQSTIKTSNI